MIFISLLSSPFEVPLILGHHLSDEVPQTIIAEEAATLVTTALSHRSCLFAIKNLEH